jgi:hypothetical protein
MTRPNQLRRIVALLRAQRPDAEYRHLLRLAALIIEAHREPEVLNIEASPLRPSIHSMAVDRAFGDGGWGGVLRFERSQGMSFGDNLPDDYYVARERIWRLTRRS